MIFFLLPLIFSLASCQKSDPHCKHARRVLGNFIGEVVRSDEMYPFGTGAAMMGDIQEICVDLDKVGNFEFSEARTYVISKAELLIKMMNEDIEIRPYLHDYPATAKNISFAINFTTPEGKEVPYPYISRVSVLLGDLDYYVKDKRESIFCEPYEKALLEYRESCNRSQ